MAAISATQTPLDPDRETYPLAISVEGQAVTGTVRPNWGTLEVAIATPFAGLTRSWTDMDWIMANDMSVGGWWDGSPYLFTDRVKAEAERLLAGLFLDCQAVQQHQDEVRNECGQARQELEGLAREVASRQEALRQERLALRRRLRAGEMDHREYQAAVLGLRRRGREIEAAGKKAVKQALERFTARARSLTGRELSLEDAERSPALTGGG
jgi:hypothetical protein